MQVQHLARAEVAIHAKIGFEQVDHLNKDTVFSPRVNTGKGAMNVEEVPAAIRHSDMGDIPRSPKGVSMRGGDINRIDCINGKGELDIFMEAIDVEEMFDGVEAVVAGVADSQVHGVVVAGTDTTFGGELCGIAIVLHTRAGRVVDIVCRVGTVIAACGTCRAAGACTCIHGVDRHGDAVGIGCGDRARDNSHVFGGNHAGDRIRACQEEGKYVVITGAHPVGILFGAEHIVKAERIGIGQEVEVKGCAVVQGAGGKT